MEFCVLASGSSGNVSLAVHEECGVLIDLGLGPRRLERALAGVGRSWDDIRAAVLTHTHGDHWNPACIDELCRRGITLFCHARHERALSAAHESFAELTKLGLVRTFDLDRRWPIAPRWTAVAFAVPHDAGLTCGYRLEAWQNQRAASVLGYAADLGSWNEGLARRLANVDILALEFNHDEALQRDSGRPRFLIERVLGARGHLSNVQAAELLRAILRASEPGRLSHLFQLHLSGQCNDPDLARHAVLPILADLGWPLVVHTANAAQPTAWARPRAGLELAYAAFRQAWLPGWEAV